LGADRHCRADRARHHRAATQWTAWRLGFQPQLGQPWFNIWPGMPVYLPQAFFW
jgi:hypothetical protein